MELTKDYKHTSNLSEQLALIKGRKADIQPRLRILQVELAQQAERTTIEAVEALADEGSNLESLRACWVQFGRIQDVIDAKAPQDAERAARMLEMQNLTAEVSRLNELSSKVGVQYKFCIDQILINQLKAIV